MERDLLSIDWSDGICVGGVMSGFQAFLNCGHKPPNVCLIASLKPLLVFFFCRKEPNLTRPMAVANSGWSSADFRPLMELALPKDAGNSKTFSASFWIPGMRAPPPQIRTPARK